MSLISDPITLITGILIVLVLFLLISCHLYAPKLFSADQSSEEQQRAAAARRRQTALKASKSGLDMACLESFPTMTVAQARKEDALRELVRLQMQQEKIDELFELQHASAECIIHLTPQAKDDASGQTTRQKGTFSLPGYCSCPAAMTQGEATGDGHCVDVEAVNVSADDVACVRECVVCLAEYEDKEIVRRLPHCSHWFHAACIDQWLTSRATCPLCRTSMKQVEEAGGREADGVADEDSAPVAMDVAVVISSSHGQETNATNPHTQMQQQNGQGQQNSTRECSLPVSSVL